MNDLKISLLWLFAGTAMLFSSCTDDEADSKGLLGPGTSLDQLEGIYIHLEYTYGLGVQVTYKPYVFFNDHYLYVDADIDPVMFKVEESKKKEPEKWGRWEKQGDEIVITRHDGTTSIWSAGQWYKTIQAQEGEKISGCYKSLSGVSNIELGGTSTVLSVKNVCFDESRFTYETFGGSASGSTTSYSSETKAGTYGLNGYTITLTFNNGIVSNKLFFFMPDSRDVFCIGSTYYIEDK